MFNLSQSIAALRDAETIIASTLLTDDDKSVLIGELVASVPPSFNRPHIDTIQNALERIHAIYRPAPARPTPRESNTAPVVEGSGEGPAEAGEGPTEGEPEQAQDAGGVAVPSDGDNAPSEALAKAQRQKQGKAR